MLRKSFYSLVLIFGCLAAKGQSELTLGHLSSVYQASYINPAAIPDHKVSFSFPGLSSIYAGITHTGFSYYDIERARDTISLTKLADKVRKHNYVYSGANIELLHLRINVRNNYYISAHIRERIDERFAYPGDLVRLAVYGNGAYLGQTIDLSGLSIQAQHYREYAIGFAKEADKSPVSFGVRLKLLQGLANVSMRNKELSMRTDADMYSLNGGADGVLNTSLPVDIEDDSTDTDIDVTNYLTNFRNKGLGLDLGMSYKVTDRLTVSGALNNIGFISWKTNVRNYRLAGESTFSGIDISDQLTEEDPDINFENYLDSLGNSFDYTKTSESYTTWLIPQLYLTAGYSLARKTDVFGTVYLEKFRRIRPAFSIALSQKVGKFLQGVVSYSYQYGSFKNIGLGLVVKPGPIQFYLAGDNVLGIIDPLGARSVNVRFGINIVLGKKRSPLKQPTPEDL